MAYSNAAYSVRLVNNEYLEPAEAVWTATHNIPNAMKVFVQLEATPDRLDYSPPMNPPQQFQVSIYPIGLEEKQDSQPLETKLITVYGDGGIGSIGFETVAIPKVRFRFQNSNAYGLYLTVRMTEAIVQ